MGFTGQVTSDLVKKARLDDSKKEDLLDFAATDFITLRENLINYIKAAYPLDYNFFAESDLGMMLIELVAGMGHILSYKADYLANENYLRTARSRNSVRKLLELIGIRMRGPTAAVANARITLDTPNWTTSTDSLTIDAQQRVITVTSPEDGSQVTFTLYKTTPDGLIEFTDASEGITIYRNENATSSVLENVVLMEGALVKQTGTFSDTESIKTISLTESPVIEGSIQVFIESNGGATEGKYEPVENIFFASGPNDKVYQITTDEDFRASLFFGDNLLGMSPKNGDNFTVYYRVGGGSRGNVAKSAINAPVNVEYFSTFTLGTGTGTIENISQAAGGAPAQTIENAKRYAPLLFRSQDRLVTVNDYLGFTNSFKSTIGTVAKATVSVRKAFSSANIIDLFILEKANATQFKRATPEFKRQLLEAIEPKKMLTDEIIVVDGLIRTLDLVMTIRCDQIYKRRESDIKLKVRDSILSYFNVDNLDFAKPFNAQDLNRNLFNDVPEVRYSTVDNLPQTIKFQFNEIMQLNNLSLIMVFE